MSEHKNNNESKKKVPSMRQLKNMGYMELLENYIEYPQKNLKFNYISSEVDNAESLRTSLETGKKIKFTADGREIKKAKFLSEKDKADGWNQKFSRSKKFSKFFQTNLHYLPEHLWTKLLPFYQETVLVGYKTKDTNVHYFVHNADTDESSWALFNAIKNRYTMDRERVQQLLNYFEEKGIESWLTIRAKEYME